MGKKPKAPDMSWQVQAAQAQENRLAQQQKEIDLKTEQTAMSNTEKLRNIRRRALGRSILEPTRVAAPPSELSDVEKQKLIEQNLIAENAAVYLRPLSPKKYSR